MDLLTDPYLAELRALDAELARLETLNPLAAPAKPSLSPDAGADGADSGLIEGVK